MQIAFWSNLHGQGATTATTVATACIAAQTTAQKTLIAHNHIEKNALEGYLLRKQEKAAIKMLDFSNQGLDALIRLYRNGRLKSAMIPDYTFSLMKNHALDILFGSEKKDGLAEDTQHILLNIFDRAREAYDVIMLDLHSGLDGTNSRVLLETSDIVVFCLCQNHILLENFHKVLEENPVLKRKRSAYILSRYDETSALTRRNIARRYHIDSDALFAIPYQTGFMDACNSGRVFDYISFGLSSKRSDRFIQELSRLTQFVMEGCQVQACPS